MNISALMMTVLLAAGGSTGQLHGGGDLQAIFPHPPWRPAAEEAIGADQASFAVCDHVVAAMSARGGDAITERVYSTSPKWGRILRVKLAGHYPSTATLFTCWIPPGRETASMVAAIEGTEDGE